MYSPNEEKTPRVLPRSIFFLGNTPWNIENLIRESAARKLTGVLIRLASDASETRYATVASDSQQSSAAVASVAVESLPDSPDELSDDLLLQLVERYGAGSCVFPLNDYLTEHAAVLSGYFGDRCYPRTSAQTTNQKHRLRAIWNEICLQAATDLSSVEFCRVEMSEDGSQFHAIASAGFESLAEETRFIVKPDALSGSIEISSAPTKRAALAAARHTCTLLEMKWRGLCKTIGATLHPHVLIEQAIEPATDLHAGAEYSVEFLSFRGIHTLVGITQKWTTANFVESGQMFPAETFPKELKAPLEAAIRRMLEALEVGSCLSHWEFIVTADRRIALVEGHLRPAGDRILDLAESSTGMSPIGALCQAFATGKTDFSFEAKRSCGIFWMVPSSPLTEVTGVLYGAAVSQNPEAQVYLDFNKIQVVSSWAGVSNSMTRLAHVIAPAADACSVLRICREIASSVVLHGMNGSISTSVPLMLSIDVEED